MPTLPPAPAAPKRGDPRGLALAWAASFVLLAVLAWAAIAFRTEVMRAWPPSERVYAALGLLASPGR